MRLGGLVMLTAWGLCGAPAGSAELPVPGSTGAAVVQATRAFYAALNRGDAKDADQYLLPGGDSFPRDGGRLSPEPSTPDASFKELADKFAAGLRFRMTLEDLQVHVYGEDTAIVTFYAIGSTSLKERTLSQGTYRASYVWVHAQGGWKIAHFHLSPLKP